MSDPSISDDLSRERRALGAPALDGVRDALEAGVQAYRQGDYQAARTQAENALKDMPNQPDALHLMALISQQAGALDAAIGYIERALAVTPDSAAYQNNLATMYLAAGRDEDARAILGRLMDNHPDYPGGYYNLANIFKADGDLQSARNHYRLALNHKPDFIDAHINLTQTLLELGNFDEALDSARSGVECGPVSALAHESLAAVLLSQNDCAAAADACRKAIGLDAAPGEPYLALGNALIGLGEFEAAIEPLCQAKERLPDHAVIHNSLGVALLESNRLDEAEVALRRAIELVPTMIEAYSNLAHLLILSHQPEDAAAHAWRAVELDKGFAAGWNNLAGALLALDQPAEALTAAERALALGAVTAEAENTLGSALSALARDREARMAFERAIALAPKNAEIHFNHALSLLTAGNYRAGFAEYEWRLKLGGGAVSHLSTPMWDGTALDGATILLHAEQGFGDSLQFIRYAPLVAEQGGRVVLACQEPLKRLLQGVAGISETVALDGPVPAFEHHATLASLAHILDVNPEKLPPAKAYVGSSEAPWQFEAPAAARLKIGIAWSGSPANKINRRRSCPVDFLTPLFGRDDIACYSLQVGPGSEDISGNGQIEDLSPRLKDFADTAAAIAGLDLVITIDSAVAHLAGALGHPVWVMLSHSGDWRYLRGREDNPWYPTMRHFRQPEPGDWAAVVSAVQDALDGFGPSA
ncbi:MAG: tetratricopeptide repeat protein [Rhodospirillaceae bacterium]|nr:tetratricopeptide repeat protein [Rhodospirillaceae bacterium]